MSDQLSDCRHHNILPILGTWHDEKHLSVLYEIEPRRAIDGHLAPLSEILGVPGPPVVGETFERPPVFLRPTLGIHRLLGVVNLDALEVDLLELLALHPLIT
jgi:hypothetical protein